MHRMLFIFIGLCLLLVAAVPSAAQDFWTYWGDGKGEVSSYRVVVPRYGAQSRRQIHHRRL